MSLAFFVGWLQRSPAFLHLLHYLKQLPRLGFPSVVTLSAFIPAASNKLRIIKTPLFPGGLKAETQLDFPYIEEPKPA